jgi:hypothetical protein
MGRLIDLDTINGTFTPCETYSGREVIALLNQQPSEELRLLKNYLHNKSKAYRQRTPNYVVVRELIMSGTSHAGMTSCIMKCHELGINPYGYDLKGAVNGE